MNIMLLTFGELDKNNIKNFKGPLIDTINYSLDNKEDFNIDLYVIYMFKDYVSYEKNFNIVSKVMKKLKSEKNNIEYVIEYNSLLNIYDFNQLDGIVNSYYQSLIKLNNISFKKDNINLFLSASSEIINLDLSLFLLPYKFKNYKNVQFFPLKNHYSISEKNINEYDIKKTFYKCLTNYKEKEIKLFSLEQPSYDYNAPLKKTLNACAYITLKNILISKYTLSDKLTLLLDYAIAIEKWDLDYLMSHYLDIDFFPKFNKEECGIKNNDIENINYAYLVLVNRIFLCYINLQQRNLKNSISKIEGLVKDSLIFTLTYFSKNKAYTSFLQIKDSKASSIEDILLCKCHLNINAVKSKQELYKCINNYYIIKNESSRTLYLNAHILYALNIYFLKDNVELTSLLNSVRYFYFGNTFSNSIYAQLNNITHNIANYKEDSLYSKAYSLLGYLFAILLLATKKDENYDFSSLDLKSKMQNQKFFEILNKNIEEEIDKLTKKKDF